MGVCVRRKYNEKDEDRNCIGHTVLLDNLYECKTRMTYYSSLFLRINYMIPMYTEHGDECTYMKHVHYLCTTHKN